GNPDCRDGPEGARERDTYGEVALHQRPAAEGALSGRVGAGDIRLRPFLGRGAQVLAAARGRPGDGGRRCRRADAQSHLRGGVLSANGYGPSKTEIVDAPEFYFAEDYHQQYLAKVPHGYCGLGGTGLSCPVGVGVKAEA